MLKLPVLSVALLSLFAACGDNNEGNPNPDGGGPNEDAGSDAPDDTGPDPFTFDAPYKVPLSAEGPDQIQAVIAGPTGTNYFYYAGFVAETAAGPKAIFVGKVTPTGPDTTFGSSGGVAILKPADANAPADPPFVSPTGSTDEIDLALQSDGKIIVSFTIADETVATDRDIGVLRLDPATGAVDGTFGDGTSGLARIDFGSPTGTNTTQDGARGLAVDSNNNIFVHATAARPTAGSTDADFAVAKLLPDGQLDDDTTTGWGTNNSGMYFQDIVISTTSRGATPRGIKALADGSVIAGGYLSMGVTEGAQIVLFKLDSAGDLETDFNSPNGYFHSAVLPIQTEVYNFAVHGDSIITGGYGREVEPNNVWVSLKFNATTGVRDTTFGGATDGAVLVDPSGGTMGNNCRNAVALPDGKTLLLGSTGPGNMAAQDAAFAVLDANGMLDADYDAKAHTVKFTTGGVADQNDAFWGAAANATGTHVMLGGYRGTAGAAQSDVNNDDAYVVMFEIQ